MRIGKRRVNNWAVFLIAIIAFTAVDQMYLNTGISDIYMDPLKGGITPEGEYSRFTGTLVKKDAVATTVGTEIACAWYDWNGDGSFSFGEVEQMTTSSGAFTSTREYPIGQSIYVQFDDEGEDYQTEVYEIKMLGSRNSDGSAKQIGNLEAMATEDAITWSGLVGITGIDDGTDYNYTLNGATKTVNCYAALATSDAGFTSQSNGAFRGSDSHSFYSWITEKEYMQTFFGFYVTNQDAIDMGLKVSQFDYYHVGATNTFCAIFFNEGEFYDSDATNAPTWEISFDVVIGAAAEIVYIGLFQDVALDDFYKDVWTPTTDATILGTQGAGWAIVA